MVYVSLFINSLIIFAFSYWILNGILLKKRITDRLQMNEKKTKKNRIKEAKKMIKSKNTNQSNDLITKVENKLLDSDINMEAKYFIGVVIIALIVLDVIAIFISRSILPILLITIIIPIFINVLLNKLRNIRLKKMEAQLLDMTLTLTSNLKSGYSLIQGFNSIVEEGLDPISTEIELFLRDITIGISYEDAVDKLLKRNPIEDLEILMIGILINKENGGSISYILENIIETIREKERINGEVKSLTAQGRLSGLILSLMPVGLTVMLYLLNPEYMKPLFYHPLGRIMLIAGALGELIGILIIKKITKIEW